MTSSVVAVEGRWRRAGRGGLRARGAWRDLWVLRFDDDGRCLAFEEWPFAPDQPDGH